MAVNPRKKHPGGGVYDKGNGTYYARVSTVNGRRASKNGFTSISAARAWVAKIKTSVQEGTYKTPEELEAEKKAAEKQALKDGYTFGEYAKKWLEFKRSQLSHTTIRAYSSHLRTHILPKWGDTPIKEIAKADIAFWLLNDFDPSRPGRKSVYDTFRAILNSAVDDEIIDKNPCGRNMLKVSKDIKRVSQRTAPRALTKSELLAVATEYGRTSPHMYAFVLLVGFLGLRLGEARELRLKDIDFERGTLRISRACAESLVDGKAVVSVPKTAKSRRTIPIPTQLLEVLNNHIARYGGNGGEGLVFPSPFDRSKHIGGSTVRIGIKRAAQRVGIKERVNVHDLRHTAASLMLHAQGCTQEEAKALLGHESSVITQRYVHHEEERLRLALEAYTGDLGVSESNILPFTSNTR